VPYIVLFAHPFLSVHNKMIKTISITFTLIGIVLLAQALKPAYSICKRELNWGWRSLVILISLFIVGYGVMITALYQSPNADAFDLVVAIILLGGSVFVALVMKFSLRSINKIRDITRLEHHHALLDERNRTLLARLPLAITENEFELHYQPLIDPTTKSIHSVECLIRWPQTDGSAVATSDFIHLAEQSHVIVDITRWVISTSLKQLGLWHANGHKLALQINISTRDLNELDLVSYISKHLHSNKIKPSDLTLEITENQVINHQTECFKILQQLRHLGVGISLDDFGTGYSSMTWLNQLPLTQIKIDRSFVIGMEHNKKHMAIVQSTLDLGIKMGLEVIAEGVENAQQAQLLKQMNCALLQGYYLAKPMPAEKLDQWLNQAR
jgi:EAL domain-containing protein (putative c-di-GMP-specific phosphodiesterase class I)